MDDLVLSLRHGYRRTTAWLAGDALPGRWWCLRTAALACVISFIVSFPGPQALLLEMPGARPLFSAYAGIQHSSLHESIGRSPWGSGWLLGLVAAHLGIGVALAIEMLLGACAIYLFCRLLLGICKDRATTACLTVAAGAAYVFNGTFVHAGFLSNGAPMVALLGAAVTRRCWLLGLCSAGACLMDGRALFAMPFVLLLQAWDPECGRRNWRIVAAAGGAFIGSIGLWWLAWRHGWQAGSASAGFEFLLLNSGYLWPAVMLAFEGLLILPFGAGLLLLHQKAHLRLALYAGAWLMVAIVASSLPALSRHLALAVPAIPLAMRVLVPHMHVGELRRAAWGILIICLILPAYAMLATREFYWEEPPVIFQLVVWYQYFFG